jgi:hypothetical protein
MHNGRCLGFLLRRGPQGVEVFDRDERSLGFFTDEHQAIRSLLDPKGGAAS